MTEKTIKHRALEQVAAFLLDAITWVLASYVQFSKDKPGEQECKDFAARHSAGKAAISHVEMLIKLARTLGVPNLAAENHHQQIALAALLQEAQEEVDGYKMAEGGRG